jgi:PAS domain S-box-containing protein
LAEEKRWAEFKLKASTILADVESDLITVLQVLCVEITDYFDVVCDFQLLNEEKQIIELVALHHHNKEVKHAIEETLTKRVLEVGEGMVGNVVKSGKEFFVDQLPETLKIKSEKEGVNPLVIPCSFAYLPLKSHGQVLGTMDLTRLSDQSPISEKELTKMRDLADHTAKFIENRMLQATQLREIELRKRAEQKLARSTKMLEKIEADTRSMLNTIPIYIARVSKDFRYIFLNDFYQNLGVSPRKLEGKKLVEVIGQDRFNRLLPYFEKALNGELVNYEYDRASASGQLHYFNVSLAPDKSETGEVLGFFSCAVDITEKVLAERQTQLTQDRLKTLSLNSGDAFFFHDEEQNILDVNDVATEMLGYSREELLSMRASEIDPRWSGTIYQKFLSELGTNVPQTFYSTVVSKKGKRIPVEVRFVKRVESGEVYIQSLIRDRTEKFKQEQKLQQSEERLRLIFENVEDYIATISEEGIFESINKTSQGHEQEDVIGTSIYDFYDNPEKEELLRSKFKTLIEKGESFEIEDFYTGPDGSTSCYLRKFIPVTYNGRFFKCILIIRDVTAERTKERAEMNAVLKGQEQERKRLGAELHDGIGQVLSAIVLQVSQLEASASNLHPHDLNAEMNQLKHNLREAIREVRNISHDLMPEMLESFGLEEAVKQVCNQLEKRAGIRVTFNVADLEPRYDSAIEVNLFRITQELVNNIQKHANCTKVFVNLIDHGNSLSLSVEDDGTGFQQNAIHKGIGLSNVRSRIAMLNGELEIESDENSGTLINIEVPKRIE